MKKGDKLFVRIDSKVEGNELKKNDFNDHISYLKKIASKKHFLGGGFVNKPGGMIVFEAKNIEEAKKISDLDPLIKRNLYKYEIFEWKLAVLSNDEY